MPHFMMPYSDVLAAVCRWCKARPSMRHTALQTYVGKKVEGRGDISQMSFIRAMAIRQLASSVPAVKMRTIIGMETMQEGRDGCS